MSRELWVSSLSLAAVEPLRTVLDDLSIQRTLAVHARFGAQQTGYSCLGECRVGDDLSCLEGAR